MKNSSTASAPFDLVIRDGTCVLPDPKNPQKLITQKTNIGIRDGKIEAIGDLTNVETKDVWSIDGLHVLPGLIDTQVHFREPGLEHKEDLATGTAGAIAGGITGVFEMPNTKPSTTTPEALKEKLKRADGRAWCDYSFYLGASPENASQLGELENLDGCCGIKVFMGSSTGSLLVEQEDVLDTIVRSGKRRMAVHCEDEARLKERYHLVKDFPTQVQRHPMWRDEQTALLATQKLVRLAKKHNRQVHVLHVTTAEEMEFLKDYKDVASVECTPQHLTLSAPECYERLGTLAQMNPPIREERHRQALWKALKDGIVDIIGSDHAPHTFEEKQKPYPQSPSGMTGVQTTLPLMLNHINEGRLSLEKLVELMAVNPCRLFHIKDRGAIQVGAQATLTVIDLKARRKITNEWIQSRSGWTPFDGMIVEGWPVSTIIRGHFAMMEDEINGSPIGKPIQFENS